MATIEEVLRLVGRTVAHYRVLEKLGEGGIGVVYKARDEHLGPLVALKILTPDRVADPERKRRFVHEAKAASALNQPNIVTIYDIDSADGVDFNAMEYVESRTLGQLIGPSGLKLEAAMEYATALSGAMAHRAGIVHRDLKPANIMVSEQGHVKVLDFGLAKLTERVAVAAGAETVTESSITKEGVIVGTVAYMSPEQVEIRPADARSDVFSFGAVFCEMLTGRRAFQGDSTISTMSAILRDSPPRPRELRTGIPHDVERILRRCLEKDREARYPSAVELHEELHACQARMAAREIGLAALLKRPRFAVPALALLLVIAAASGWFWLRASRANRAADAVPEIAWLAEGGQYPEAQQLAIRAARYLPADRRLAELLNQVSVAVSVQTNVPGAGIRCKEYAASDSQWRHLGRSPIESVRVPLGLKRWRIAIPFHFIVRSGRAVLYPVYKSTFERGDGLLSDRPNVTSSYRDHVIQWYKDFARSIDYLETRQDMDARKLGYYGTSWGAVMGPILLALETAAARRSGRSAACGSKRARRKWSRSTSRRG